MISPSFHYLKKKQEGKKNNNMMNKLEEEMDNIGDDICTTKQ